MSEFVEQDDHDQDEDEPRDDDDGDESVSREISRCIVRAGESISSFLLLACSLACLLARGGVAGSDQEG